MVLLTPGYWQTTYWPSQYWQEDYWPEYGFVVPPTAPPSYPAVLPPRRRRVAKHRIKPSTLMLVRDYLELKLRQKQNA